MRPTTGSDVSSGALPAVTAIYTRCYSRVSVIKVFTGNLPRRALIITLTSRCASSLPADKSLMTPSTGCVVYTPDAPDLPNLPNTSALSNYKKRRKFFSLRCLLRADYFCFDVLLPYSEKNEVKAIFKQILVTLIRSLRMNNFNIQYNKIHEKHFYRLLSAFLLLRKS